MNFQQMITGVAATQTLTVPEKAPPVAPIFIDIKSLVFKDVTQVVGSVPVKFSPTGEAKFPIEYKDSLLRWMEQKPGRVFIYEEAPPPPTEVTVDDIAAASAVLAELVPKEKTKKPAKRKAKKK